VLDLEPNSRFTVVYANRDRGSTMFAAQLDAIKAGNRDRVEILNVQSRGQGGEPLLVGRIDRGKLNQLLATVTPPDEIDEWLLCGPLALMTLTREVLAEHGVRPEQVHAELFYGYDATRAGSASTRPSLSPARLNLRLGGELFDVDLAAGERLLDGALRVCPDVPYACMGGACGTCRARLVGGSVEMRQDFALAPDQRDAGLVLPCQAIATSGAVRLDFDV
jgi:ferredoxin-NADP reductase